MKSRTLVFPGAAIVAACMLATTTLAGAMEGTTHHGETTPLGNGTANAYVTLDGDAFVAVGVRISEAALASLPAEPNTESKCFDGDGNGRIDGSAECLGDYEMDLAFPPQLSAARTPFKWIALNWEAHGHVPPGVYDVPHFDFHFYMVDRESVRAIRLGPCDQFIDCDDLETARMPLAPAYMPEGYVEVGAAAGRMGNHLIDTRSPEFAKPPLPFTHTFIYGIYGGHVTFLEPMITRDFLLTAPSLCVPIAQPAAWEASGSYPTEYCMRHLPNEGVVTVSLEGFVSREAVAVSE